MEIEDFKRWHWIAISLVIGGVLAYARTWIAPDEQSSGRGISSYVFVTQVNRAKTGNGFAWVKDVVIYPPQTVNDGSSNSVKRVNFVTCSLLTQLPNGKGQYQPVHFMADIPFKVGNIVPKGDDFSIRNYLQDLKQTNDDASFRYAWWTQRNAQFAIWMAGSVVLIGGIWPSLVNLMIGAGLGRPKKTKEQLEQEAYDLERFGKHKEPAKPAVAAKAGISAQDSQRLKELQDELEQNLAAAGVQMTDGQNASAGASATGGTVKQFTGGPAVPVAPVKPEDNEPKEYMGEFYPVVKPHHHEEEKKH